MTRCLLELLPQDATAELDLIATHEQSAEWIKAADAATLLPMDKPRAEDWASFGARWSERKPSDEDKRQATQIFHWANRREFVAIAILEA